MNADWAKVMSMGALGFGTVLVGLVPAAFSRYNLRQNPLLFTVLLCFGAGVLMATSLVHMLPEVREDLSGGYAEIVFCIGFMIVYLCDELLHYCCGEAIQHAHGPSDEEERQPILPPHSHSHQHNHQSYGTNTTVEKTESDSEVIGETSTCEEHQHRHDVEDESINARICHTNHQEPCAQTLAGIIGMLTALSIHALLEGLAIGIQDTVKNVMVLFTAVVSHKLVVGFCLGVELSASPSSKFKHHFLAILLFAMGSVLGIAIGMALGQLQLESDSKFLPILQGIAGGTLLYVTLCEVLPREKARWHSNRYHKAAGLCQLLAFAIGFALMTLMTLFINEDD